MSIDLSQFHQVFFEESIEGLDVMEEALMDLDVNAPDDETINSIFRSAHSIKGGSATFGFTSVAEFTHDLETLLDQVRAGDRCIYAEDINLFLRSVDCMREMISLLQDGENAATDTSAELKSQFSVMLKDGTSSDGRKAFDVDTHGDGANQIDEADIDAFLASQKTIVNSGHEGAQEKPHWKIHFAPGEGVLKTGNDPLKLLRDLAELGEMQILDCQISIPEFSSFDSELCYLAWDIDLYAQCEEQNILEIFEWILDESELNIAKKLRPKVWNIEFSPQPQIFQSGNEPLRLLSALEEFGQVISQVKLTNLPELGSIDPELCYLSWSSQLSSDSVDEAGIREVFEWIEDEADIEVQLASPHAGDKNIGAGTEAPTTSNQSLASVLDTLQDPAIPVDSNASAQSPLEAAPTNGVKAAESIPVKKSQALPGKPKKVASEASSIRVGIDKVDNLINMVGELVITQSMLGQLGTDFDVSRLPKLLEGLNQLEQNTRELQESVMRIRMLPISFAFSRFPRMIRDLSQVLGKSVDLKMLGEHTELDKTVMEKIGDPLVHLVRNAIDHGIEMPDDRKAAGKSPTGKITLNAYHQGGNVVIEIEDDGKGLDRKILTGKAIEKGLITATESENMSDEQAFELIFHPGFSTAQKVSDVSGRGVGMDVVKKNIQALSGAVEISSALGRGSKITIRLPLTLAILDGQLIRVGQQTYIFPLVSIVESLLCDKQQINQVAGGNDVFKLREDYVPIIELHEIFNIQPDPENIEKSLMVVVECDGSKAGIVVDELMAQQQVVIKSLEQNYHRVEGVSGATILGDGTVALILDISGLVKLANQHAENCKRIDPNQPQLFPPQGQQIFK